MDMFKKMDDPAAQGLRFKFYNAAFKNPILDWNGGALALYVILPGKKKKRSPNHAVNSVELVMKCGYGDDYPLDICFNIR